MKIWTFINTNMLPEHGHMNRHYYFGKELARQGHDVTVFAGSHPHNSDVQLITDGSLYKIWREEPFRWIYVKTLKYGRNRIKEVLSMFVYYCNALRTAKRLLKEKDLPDVFIGSTPHPLSALIAVTLGRKYHRKTVVEVRDLWPESIVAYGIAGPKNPLVFVLRCLEKYLYTHADAVIFTAEGAYDYIIERGWAREIPREKVYHINNGVDLEQFRCNRDNFPVEDSDLSNPDLFKVVYAGSIRKVNNLGVLLDAAKCVTNPRVKFLIYGDGNERKTLEKRVKDEGITNVVFKGRVEKKHIPSIVSQADVNFMHGTETPLLRFGISPNKLFDYFAAGKPILSDLISSYDPIRELNAGVIVDVPTAENIAAQVEQLVNLDKPAYEKLCRNAEKGAQEYEFKVLAKKMIRVIEGDKIPCNSPIALMMQ